MADAGGTTPQRDDSHDFGKAYDFQDIFQTEIDVINERRAGSTVEVERIEDERGTVALGDPDRRLQGPITLEQEGEDVSGRPVFRPNEDANMVGLSLSGGGIRSAALCLGVLQALDKAEVLRKVDYLSTVSGGGYIGCSLTAAQQAGAMHGCPGFPFASALYEDEPPALQHIRDYSNYLFPHRSSSVDLLRNAAIYARGLVANAVILIPFLFGAAVITLLCYAVRDAFTKPSLFGVSILDPFGLRYFFISLDLFLILIVIGVGWGIFQSTRDRQQKAEIPGWPSVSVSLIIVVFLFVVFCELQPFILDSMIGANGWAAVVTKWVNTISAILAPVSAAFAYLSSKLGEYLKSATQSPSAKAQTKGFVVKAAVVVGGLVLPVLLWMFYLNLTFWGLCIDTPKYGCMAPFWLASAAHAVFPWQGHAAMALLAFIALVCLGLTLLMQPNANSLHSLYRDRLSKAFLFRPWPSARTRQQARPRADMPVPWPIDLEKSDLVEQWRPKLSEITGLAGPYHLINTAINVEASSVANRRGRNADFFIFSPKFVGSKSTGYVSTIDVEEVATGLTLATAMAASGAAVSSNMGAETIKPLTATLALLNVRLGYWLRNPAKLHGAKRTPSGADVTKIDHRNLLANYYFIGEVLGQLSEKRKSVYLTDGGHIENLGIYELLRRRCRVIIAVDAEADPQMAFGSFNILERYALIDMGVRIDLPWQPIADESLVTSKAIDNAGALIDRGDGETGNTPSRVKKDHGPHCAVGEISYPGGRKGVLVYIKASLTGDENDYVFDYKKVYSDFPHETTIDQMFTEAQFEAYRALGFHAAFRFFDRSDSFGYPNEVSDGDLRREIGLLDRLFPRPAAAGSPGQKQTFMAWLPGPAV